MRGTPWSVAALAFCAISCGGESLAVSDPVHGESAVAGVCGLPVDAFVNDWQASNGAEPLTLSVPSPALFLLLDSLDAQVVPPSYGSLLGLGPADQRMTIVAALVQGVPRRRALSRHGQEARLSLDCAELVAIAAGAPKRVLDVAEAVNAAAGTPATNVVLANEPFKAPRLVWQVAFANDLGEASLQHRWHRLVSGPSTIISNPIKQLADAISAALAARGTAHLSGRPWVAVATTQRHFSELVRLLGRHPPAVDPVASPTRYNPIVISGTTEPNATISISGGATAATALADAAGVFSAVVELRPNAINLLVVAATNSNGELGPSTTVSVQHDDVTPEGFTWPDPFEGCEPATLVLRSPDLSTPAAETVTVTFPEERLIRAPGSIAIRAADPAVASALTVVLQYGTAPPNTCRYPFSVVNHSFVLSSCDTMVGSSPASATSSSVTMSLSGVSALRGVTVRSEVEIVTPCGGRNPLRAGKFFDRRGIRDRWLVALDERRISGTGVAAEAQRLATAAGGSVVATFAVGPLGFALAADRAGALRVASDSAVRFVESDVDLRGAGITQPLTGTQWALDRIDQVRSQPVAQDLRFRWPATGLAPALRPRLFLLDTQVLDTHSFLIGVVVNSHAPWRSQCALGSGNESDHGTQVAALLAGRFGSTQNLARELVVEPVLGAGALSCTASDGTTVANALQDVLTASAPGDIVNMSLGGTALAGFIEMKINALLSGGRVVVASAGNESTAVNYPPANISGVLTVGGTQMDDSAWPGTNFGPEVELYAPAAAIYTATDTSNIATTSNGFGTSLATPVVAGIAFHSVLGSTPQGTATYVQGIVDGLIDDGVSMTRPGGRVDVLPVLRGRVLELGKSPSFSAPNLGTALDALQNSLFIGVTLASGPALLRVPLQANGLPAANQTPIPVRANAGETCFALGARPYNFEMLAGCWTPAGSELVSYDDQGQQTGTTVITRSPAEVPFRIAIDDRFSGSETQVILMNHATPNGGGACSNDFDCPSQACINSVCAASHFPAWSGQKISIATIEAGNTLNVLDIPAPPGRFMFGVAIAVFCPSSNSCDAFALSNAVAYTRPNNVLSDTTLLLHKVTYNPNLPRPSSATLVKEIPGVVTDTGKCFIRGIAMGFGPSAVGVIADASGFKLVYTTSDTIQVGANCELDMKTRIATAMTDDLWGRNEIAGTLSWNAPNRTALITGNQAAPDGMSLSPRIWGTDATLTRRMEWQPPFRPDGAFLSSGYRGFVIESDGNFLNLTLHWFDP